MLGSNKVGEVEEGSAFTVGQVKGKWLGVTVDGRSGWIGPDVVRHLDLFEAAGAGDLHRVRKLLDEGAFVDMRDKASEIQIAVAPSGETMFVGAEGNLKMKTDAGLGLVFEPPAGSKIMPLYPGEFTPLIKAAANGHLDVVKLLVERNADIDAQCGTGATALIEACTNGHVEVVELLLEKGADASLKTKAGQTALYWATENRHAKVANLLKAHGAKK
jgi:hypothetical protein